MTSRNRQKRSKARQIALNHRQLLYSIGTAFNLSRNKRCARAAGPITASASTTPSLSRTKALELVPSALLSRGDRRLCHRRQSRSVHRHIRRATTPRGVEVRGPYAVSSFAQGNRHRGDVGAPMWRDRDGLPIAVCPHVEARQECSASHRRMDLRVADDATTLPFANGDRPLARYPGKRPLIRLTARPPQLETPFPVFNESVSLTASGELFNQHGFTAASRTLPFGTRLYVNNPATGRSVIVRINDRGPFVRGRDLDLARGAAAAIGMIEQGTATLKIVRLSESASVDL
jgi:rare lipoprotein A